MLFLSLVDCFDVLVMSVSYISWDSPRSMVPQVHVSLTLILTLALVVLVWWWCIMCICGNIGLGEHRDDPPVQLTRDKSTLRLMRVYNE